MRPRCPDRGSPLGFTLVEVMLSLSLMVIIMGCAYACLSAGFSAQKLIEPRADVLQNARVALELMAADLRSACPLPGGSDFVGMQRQLGETQADNLDFATHNYSPSKPEEGDFCEVSFFLDKNPESGQLSLFRRRNPMIGLDPFSGGRREEIATGVRALRFEYYDGIEWYDTWGDVDGRGKQQTSSRYSGNLAGMPEAVRITLSLEAEGGGKTPEPGTNRVGAPLTFMTVARLNLAANASLSSAGTTNAAAADTSNGGQGNPAQSGGTP